LGHLPTLLEKGKDRRGEKTMSGRHLSAESREKIAASKRGKLRPPHVLAALLATHIGISPSVESNAKRSIAMSGENHPFYGKHLTEEHKKKISETRLSLGIRHTPEAKARMSALHRGHKHTDEEKRKISQSHKGKKRSAEHQAHLTAALKGRITSVETREKISIAIRGENHPNWKGGISYEPYCPKFNKDLRHRIRAFFEYRCMSCGKTTEENEKELCCHHVEYNKQACCDGNPVHFAALCKKCHSKTNNDRSRWEAMLHRIIDEFYDGRSYFTKDEWRDIRND